MASVFKKKNRKSYIAQVVVQGRRLPATLGAISRTDATLARSMLSQLEQARNTGAMPSATVATWLETIGDKMHGAVVKLGLAEPRLAAVGFLPLTVGKMFNDYVAGRTDLSYRGINNIEQAGNCLAEFVGAGKMVARFSHANAVAWRRWMSTRYSHSTISGFVKKARQVFRSAIKAGVIRDNPLDGIVAGAQVNEARSQYVDAAAVLKVIEATNDPRWRLLVAMSRFAGLRVPSEAHLLKWSDVKWNAAPAPMLEVQSPKTKKQGKPSRRVPINGALMPLLKAAFDARDVGAEAVFPMLSAGYNPHTQLKRLIVRSGVEAWPRLWHNMRASCQTDLEEFLPQHVACRFMGNSPSTARKHYLQVTGAHLVKAAAQMTARNTDEQAQSPQVDMKKDPKKHENREASDANAVFGLPPRGLSKRSRTRPRMAKTRRRAAPLSARRQPLSAADVLRHARMDRVFDGRPVLVEWKSASSPRGAQ